MELLHNVINVIRSFRELIRLGIPKTHLSFIIGLAKKILKISPTNKCFANKTSKASTTIVWQLKNSLESISFANFTVTTIALP